MGAGASAGLGETPDCVSRVYEPPGAPPEGGPLQAARRKSLIPIHLLPRCKERTGKDRSPHAIGQASTATIAHHVRGRICWALYAWRRPSSYPQSPGPTALDPPGGLSGSGIPRFQLCPQWSAAPYGQLERPRSTTMALPCSSLPPEPPAHSRGMPLAQHPPATGSRTGWLAISSSLQFSWTCWVNSLGHLAFKGLAKGVFADLLERHGLDCDVLDRTVIELVTFPQEINSLLRV